MQFQTEPVFLFPESTNVQSCKIRVNNVLLGLRKFTTHDTANVLAFDC